MTPDQAKQQGLFLIGAPEPRKREAAAEALDLLRPSPPPSPELQDVQRRFAEMFGEFGGVA